MASVMSKCPFTEPDDVCRWLRDQIHKKVLQYKDDPGGEGVRGLRERIMDQVYGRNGPFNADGTPNPVWQTHDDEIHKLNENVTNLMKEHDDRDCGDRFPISAAVKKWLRTPAPRPQDWKGLRPAVPDPARFSPLSWEDWKALTGLSGVALAAYLLVSEGSRLFPARNLVPVP